MQFLRDHLPCKSVGQAFTDLLAGQIAMLSASPVEIRPYLNSGEVKPLAVIGPARSPQLTGVPTITETLRSPPVTTVNGLVAPASPQEVVDRLSREIVATEKSPEFAKRIETLGAEPTVTTPAGVAKILATPNCGAIPRAISD